jgi:hypothetical protein
MWRTTLGILALLAALVLAIYGRDQSSVFQACVADQKAAYASKQNVEGSGGVSMPFFQRKPFASQCTGAFIDENSPVFTTIATIIIAIFTVVLAVVTSRQARLTRESLIADKRAFVFPIALQGYWEIDAGGLYSWRFRPQWRNSGDTPTKNLTQYTECEIRNTPLPQGVNFSTTPTLIGTGGLLPPKFDLHGGQAPQTPLAPLTPQDILDAQAGRKFVYLWGWAKYSDVFPGTDQHITRFCWLVVFTGDPFAYDPNATGIPPAPGTLGFNYIHHTEGNCADEECK